MTAMTSCGNALAYGQKTGVFKTRNGEMTEWHLTMWDMVNPYNYFELTTFKSVIFRLTEALFRLTEALFRLTGVTFRHFVF